jgi:polyisoprenoid-binding protein YceI
MTARTLAPRALTGCMLMTALAVAWPMPAGAADGGPDRDAGSDIAGYRIDPVHTRVLFGLDHAGYTTALGTVSGSTGAIAFDPDDWSRAQVRVTVPLQRVDFGDEAWNRAARGMLDADQHPEAVFVSERVDREGDDHARACGTLTLHGTSAPFCLSVRFNQLRRAPLPPFAQTVGFSATGTLSRSAFGIDDWSRLVGDEVTFRIEVEAERDDDVLARFAEAP